MRPSCLLLPLLVISLISSSVGRGKAKDPPADSCDDSEEYNECREYCQRDRDCNDLADMNCALKCKKACQHVEKIGRCRACMMVEVLQGRGRLNGGGDGGGGGGRRRGGRGRR
ncbi:hypothetical protein HDE_09118 [Halotydeus destructor]|nr:hypothetical protein HDE_09118 [Halotydeus destructor]